MEKFIEIADTFCFNLRSTSPNLIALGIAMAFMLHRPGDDGSAGLDDKIRWSECLPGSLGKAAVNSTQLWSADDNPTSAFSSLFTTANDK